jgi:hypothetical protein
LHTSYMYGSYIVQLYGSAGKSRTGWDSILLGP